MFSIAVCDDEVIECCHMAKKIKDILEELKIPCMIRRFCNGRELLQASESFDIVFLDIMMQDLDGMKTAQILSAAWLSGEPGNLLKSISEKGSRF